MRQLRLMPIVALGLGLPVAAVMLPGCAAKRTNLALEQAREAYAQARQSSLITEHAPIALHEAEQELKHTEEAWKRDHDTEETNHLAYLAQRRTDIARAVAERRAAEVDLEQMGQRRTSVLLKATEAELAAMKVTLGDVAFEFGKANLRPGGEREIDRVVRVLKENPQRRLRIEGHTDNVGSNTANQELSERRSEAVKRYLVVQGIDPGRIETYGMGEAYPVATNATEAGRQKNRRVDLTILHN